MSHPNDDIAGILARNLNGVRPSRDEAKYLGECILEARRTIRKLQADMVETIQQYHDANDEEPKLEAEDWCHVPWNMVLRLREALAESAQP